MNFTSTRPSHHKNPDFFVFGLTGYPLGHSRSPKIHNAALKMHSLQGTYELFPIPPDFQGMLVLKQLLGKVRNGEIHGLNVTIPHKQELVLLVDELTATAAAIGAVNTVYLERGKLIGENTDAPGFWNDLSQRLEINRDQKLEALILGAGGSARAVAYALLKAGFFLIIAARRVRQAEELVNQFPGDKDRFRVIDLSSLEDGYGEPNLLVNTTPVGMYPNEEASPWPEAIPLPEQIAVYDLVYNPVETKLVRNARMIGQEAVTGLGMLVEQAALSFERWTGLSAPREAMMEAAHE